MPNKRTVLTSIARVPRATPLQFVAEAATKLPQAMLRDSLSHAAVIPTKHFLNRASHISPVSHYSVWMEERLLVVEGIGGGHRVVRRRKRSNRLWLL